MENKTYLSIIFAALALGGCANTPVNVDVPVVSKCGVAGGEYHVARTCKQHTQEDFSNGSATTISPTREPGIIVKPFQFTGRAWFDTDKAVLRPAGMKELNSLTTQLQKAKSRGLITEDNKVVILGHTDSRASRAYNQGLSVRRAKAVASYLKSKGIPTTAMLALGKGEIQPVASNRTRAGMQQNRRVEIHIEGDAIRVVSY